MTALEEFLEKYEGRPAHPKFQSLLSPFLEFCEKEGKGPGEFDDSEIRGYLLTERIDLAASTKKQALQAIRNFVKWYYAHKTQPENEAEQRLRKARIAQITLPKEAKKSTRKALELGELEKLLETAKIMGDEDFHVMYLLGYFGTRKGEFESLKEDNVDWEEQKLQVLTEKTKELRTLYFNDDAAGYLLTALENDWRTLSWRQVDEYKSLFNNVGFSLNTLRHTFNTHMRRRLEDDGLVRALMGHSDKNMTDYYDSKFQSELRDAMLNNHYYDKVKIP